jgi:vacuolar-type H+-ATPase subunit H
MREKTTRPQASETAIREMHDRASAAAHRAAQRDTDALRVISEAERATEEAVREADQRASVRMEDARKAAANIIAVAEAQAAQHIAQAEAEAEAKRGKARMDADEHMRQAHVIAQKHRDAQAAEQRDRDYWTSLASAEAAAANLPAVPPTAPLDTVPDGLGERDGAQP